jgi:hypothetical protein
MSLKTLLAVGESFSGTGTKPYEEVKKDGQIPFFATTAEGPPAAAENEMALAPTGSAAPVEDLDLERPREDKIKIVPERRRIEQEPDERRRFLKRWSKPTIRRLTQAEMSLEQVRVVRNDLSDSDLELAPRRGPRAAQPELNPFAPRPIAAIGRPVHEKSGMGTRVARWFRFLKKPRS